MTTVKLDIVESLSILFDLLDRVDEASHRDDINAILETALSLVPDYIALNPHKRIQVMAVLNRATGARVSTLDDVMGFYQSLPPEGMPSSDVSDTQAADKLDALVKKPKPEKRIKQAKKKPQTVAEKELESMRADPLDTVKLSSSSEKITLSQSIAHSIHQARDWLSRTKQPTVTDLPQADQKPRQAIEIPDADKKRQALLDRLESMRYD